MQRTAAPANDSGRYTEGNPSRGIPATVVGAVEMNLIQEEIVNVVLDAGITLDDATEDQLLAAIRVIISRGGTSIANFAIANNTGPANITTIPALDNALVKGARILFDILRRTDTQDLNEIG